MLTLKNVKVITGQIKVKTGLHIGGDSRTMEIGGMDNPIIRNPVNGEPYIPGSSIKGKLRSLYELSSGKYDKNGSCCNCGEKGCPSCTVFGSAINKNNDKGAGGSGPTRLIVRDAFLCEEDRQRFADGEQLIEEKNENSIDRITAKANPRPIERVLPGVTFDFEFIYRIYDDSDEEKLDGVVIKAMKMLEKDYLGGGGSRGNGKIEFINVKIDGEQCNDFVPDKH